MGTGSQGAVQEVPVRNKKEQTADGTTNTRSAKIGDQDQENDTGCGQEGRSKVCENVREGVQEYRQGPAKNVCVQSHIGQHWNETGRAATDDQDQGLDAEIDGYYEGYEHSRSPPTDEPHGTGAFERAYEERGDR